MESVVTSYSTLEPAMHHPTPASRFHAARHSVHGSTVTQGRRGARAWQLLGCVSLLIGVALPACSGNDPDGEARRIGDLRQALVVQGVSSPCFVTDIGNGLALGDEASAEVALPFTFNFYGTPYSSVFVNSNGNLTFGSGNPDYTTTSISSAVRPIIGPLSGDLDPGADGLGGTNDVFVNVTGTAPNRALIVTWHTVPAFMDTATNTFQAALTESGTIVYNYLDLGTSGITWVGTPFEAGVSSGAGSTTLVAQGTQIPALANTSLSLVPGASGYSQVASCDALKPPPPPNQPPTANAGPDQVVECTGSSSAIATLDGSASSDPDGDPLTYAWSSAGTPLATTVSFSASYGLGTSTVDLTVDDGKGGTATDSVNVTVQDTAAPAVNMTVVSTHFKPTHRATMQLAVSGVSATDACCDATVGITVTGGADSDHLVQQNASGTYDVYVSSQLAKGERTRTYVIDMVGADCNANQSTQSVSVLISRH